MRRTHPTNPALQTVKGVFVLRRDQEDYNRKGLELLKSMRCQVLSNMDNRVTVSSTRGNLQHIKQVWLAKKSDDLSEALNRQVAQIIIGGSIN